MAAKLSATHAELLKHCLSLAHDPIALVHFAFEWKDGESLEDWQYEALDLWGQHMRSGEKLPYRYAASSGHGIGKSTTAGLVTYCHLLSHPNSRVVITANTFAQATQKTFRAVHEWRMRLIEPSGICSK